MNAPQIADRGDPAGTRISRTDREHTQQIVNTHAASRGTAVLRG